MIPGNKCEHVDISSKCELERQYFAYNPQREIHVYVETFVFSTNRETLAKRLQLSLPPAN
jgi:hypothetical protein